MIASASFRISRHSISAASGLCLLLLCTATALGAAPRAHAGTIDLGESDLDSDLVALDGEYRFYWKELLRPAAPPGGPGVNLAVPGTWNELRRNGQSVGYEGYGTYVLDVTLSPAAVGQVLALYVRPVNTAGQFFVNGQPLPGLGTVGTQAGTTRGAIRPGILHFRADTRELRIMAHVANFEHRNGGLRDPVYLATAERVRRHQNQALFIDACLFGGILLMGLYHIGLFLNRRDDRPSLFFGLFCLTIALRVLCTGEIYIATLLPDLGYTRQKTLEYLSLFLAAPPFLWFLASNFPTRPGTRVAQASVVFEVGFSLLALLSGPLFVSRILFVHHAGTFLGAAWTVGLLSHAVYRRMAGARSALLGALVFVSTVVNDVLSASGTIRTPYLTPFGLLFFILAQSYLLSRIFSNTFFAIRRISEAYARFVPREFLDHLGRRDITEIRLGDQVEKDMTILFSDIRSFTGLSESMTPRENFNFLNSYLKRMSPIVRTHGGFIDKFIGDGIMALFDGPPEDALRAAVEMQRQIESYNLRRVAQSFEPIRIGIGIHAGRLMLGTIGAEERMEGTVVSDAVNLAARIESLTREYGAGILVSEAVIGRLPDPSRYRMRLVDRVRVKGKRNDVSVFEIFDGLPETELGRYMGTRAEFERGVFEFASGNFTEAVGFFRRVVGANPGDRAAALYLARCASALSAT